MIMRLILCAFILSSCLYSIRDKPPRKVLISNRSSDHCDSVVLYVNSFKIKIDSLAPGHTAERMINTDSVDTKHDIAYQFNVYRGASLTHKDTKFMTDLGGLPERVQVTITDSSSLLYDIKW